MRCANGTDDIKLTALIERFAFNRTSELRSSLLLSGCEIVGKGEMIKK